MSRTTQDTAKIYIKYSYRAFTFFGLIFQLVLILNIYLLRSPITPIMPKHHWFGLLRVRSPLLAQSLLFSSPAGT